MKCYHIKRHLTLTSDYIKRPLLCKVAVVLALLTSKIVSIICYFQKPIQIIIYFGTFPPSPMIHFIFVNHIILRLLGFEMLQKKR